jgi:hypothetical protein
VAKGGEHGRNVIAMLTLQPGYKSFILDAHNILITHTGIIRREESLRKASRQ